MYIYLVGTWRFIRVQEAACTFVHAQVPCKVGIITSTRRWNSTRNARNASRFTRPYASYKTATQEAPRDLFRVLEKCSSFRQHPAFLFIICAIHTFSSRGTRPPDAAASPPPWPLLLFTYAAASELLNLRIMTSEIDNTCLHFLLSVPDTSGTTTASPWLPLLFDS